MSIPVRGQEFSVVPLVDIRPKVSLSKSSSITGRALFWSVVVHFGAVVPFLLEATPPLALPQRPIIAIEVIDGASLAKGVPGEVLTPASPSKRSSAARQPRDEVLRDRPVDYTATEVSEVTTNLWDEVPFKDDAVLVVPPPELPKAKPVERENSAKTAKRVPEPPLPKPKPKLTSIPKQIVSEAPVEAELIESELAETSFQYKQEFNAETAWFAYSNTSSTESGGGACGLRDIATSPQFEGSGLANPLPTYPYKARQRGQQGQVILRVAVTAAGRPGSIEVLNSSGYRLLDRAARAAVGKWRFEPARLAGVAVAGFVDVPVTFKLSKN